MSSLRYLDIRSDSSSRGYSVYMPRPTPIRLLNELARRANDLSELSISESVHLLAVANTGVPIATAIAQWRLSHQGKSLRGNNADMISIIDPHRLELVETIESTSHTTIIVDNSVKSVHTLNQVLHKLRANRITVRYLLKLVDYEDELEQSLIDELSRAGKELRVMSILRISELPTYGDLKNRREN